MSALNREKARDVLGRFSHEIAVNRSVDGEAVLDALEACVVPDPRITRIEALHSTGWEYMLQVQAILRGNQ